MLRSFGSRSLTTRSPMRISPSEGDSRPAMHRRVVVFPQPEGPRRTTNSLSWTSKSRFSTATVPSNSFRRPRISTLAMAWRQSPASVIEFLRRPAAGSTALRRRSGQNLLGPRHRGDAALPLIDDVTGRHRHRATPRDDPSLRGESRVPYGPQEVDVELQRGEGFPLVKGRGERDAHRRVREIAQDPSVEGPHRVRVAPIRDVPELGRPVARADHRDAERRHDRRWRNPTADVIVNLLPHPSDLRSRDRGRALILFDGHLETMTWISVWDQGCLSVHGFPELTSLQVRVRLIVLSVFLP